METLTDRWRRLLKEDDRFWRICLEVAKSKPYLCAEAVESEATLIYFGLKPKPKREQPEEAEIQLIWQSTAASDLSVQNMVIVGLRKTVFKISTAHGAVSVVEGDETERLPTALGASLIVILHVSLLHLV